MKDKATSKDGWRYYRDLFSDGKTTLRRVTDADTGRVLYYIIEYETTDAATGWRCENVKRLYPPDAEAEPEAATDAEEESQLRKWFGASDSSELNANKELEVKQ